MDLFIVRHGETDGLAPPDSVLSTRGRRQAEQTAQCLSDEQTTHLLSSPLVRALGTATVIADVLDLPIEIWEDLQEGYTGSHRAYRRDDLRKRFRRAVFPESFPIDGWLHGGDTPIAMTARSQRVLATLRQRFRAEDRVALVAHGGFITYLLQTVLGMTPGGGCWFEIANCGISHLHLTTPEERTSVSRYAAHTLYAATEVEVLSINDTAHMTEAPTTVHHDVV